MTEPWCAVLLLGYFALRNITLINKSCFHCSSSTVVGTLGTGAGLKALCLAYLCINKYMSAKKHAVPWVIEPNFELYDTFTPEKH